MNAQDLKIKLEKYLGFLAQDEGNVNLLLNISNIYRLLGDWSRSQQHLDEAKLISGKAFNTEQGILHLNSQQLDLAIQSFQNALAEVDAPPQRLNLGFCLYLKGAFEEALGVLNYPEEFSMYDTFYLKARILQQLQRDEEAIILLEQLVGTNQADADVLGLLSLMHFDANRLEKAKRYSSDALRRDPSHTMGLMVETLIKSLNKQATIADLEGQLSSHPHECRLWFALGTTQFHQMNIEAAEQAFARALELWPEYYDCWISLGWCQIFQDKLTKAERTYRTATEINELGAEGWGGLALVCALRKEVSKAERLLDKTLAINPDSFLAVITQIILANHSNPEYASELLSKALPEVAAEMELLIKQLVNLSERSSQVIH